MAKTKSKPAPKTKAAPKKAAPKKAPPKNAAPKKTASGTDAILMELRAFGMAYPGVTVKRDGKIYQKFRPKTTKLPEYKGKLGKGTE